MGYCGYDTVRYVYGNKLPFSSAPPDDRALPEMHLALYNKVVVFDASTKLAYLIVWVDLQVRELLPLETWIPWSSRADKPDASCWA